MSPAESSGRSEVTPRFLRHMNILTMDQFDDVTLRRIFQTEIDWHFKVDEYHSYHYVPFAFKSYVNESKQSIYWTLFSQ